MTRKTGCAELLRRLQWYPPSWQQSTSPCLPSGTRTESAEPDVGMWAGFYCGRVSQQRQIERAVTDMRRIISLTILLVCASAGGILGQTPTPTPPSSDKVATTTPAAALKWVQARPGQESSVLWGDPRSGPFGR